MTFQSECYVIWTLSGHDFLRHYSTQQGLLRPSVSVPLLCLYMSDDIQLRLISASATWSLTICYKDIGQVYVSYQYWYFSRSLHVNLVIYPKCLGFASVYHMIRRKCLIKHSVMSRNFISMPVIYPRGPSSEKLPPFIQRFSYLQSICSRCRTPRLTRKKKTDYEEAREIKNRCIFFKST